MDGKDDTKTTECEVPADRNITLLRRRMEAEKARVIEYINDKRDSEILIDASSLRRRAEDDKAREENQKAGNYKTGKMPTRLEKNGR